MNGILHKHVTSLVEYGSLNVLVTCAYPFIHPNVAIEKSHEFVSNWFMA